MVRSPSLSISYHCCESVSHFLQAMKKTLHKIVPQHLLSVFETYELEMILYGVPFVNVDDWRSNTEYKGSYNANHKVILWFWNTLESMTQEQLCNLLHFITGSSRVPIYGFQ